MPEQEYDSSESTIGMIIFGQEQFEESFNKKQKEISLYLFVLVFVKGKKRNWSSLSAEVLTSPIVCWTLQSPLDDSGEGASWG